MSTHNIYFHGELGKMSMCFVEKQKALSGAMLLATFHFLQPKYMYEYQKTIHTCILFLIFLENKLGLNSEDNMKKFEALFVCWEMKCQQMMSTELQIKGVFR